MTPDGAYRREADAIDTILCGVSGEFTVHATRLPEYPEVEATMKPITCLVAATVAMALVVPVHAQVDCTDWNTTNLFKAAEVSDVIRCLQAGSGPERACRRRPHPLYRAALVGTAEVVTALLEAGADPHVHTEHGITPIMFAARAGRTEP